MWIKELGDVYMEGWPGDMRNPAPPSTGNGHYRPVETKGSVMYKGSFSKGADDYNPQTTPVFDQQEEVPEEMIDKREVFAKINQLLEDYDSSNPMERMAVMALSALKNMLKAKNNRTNY